MTLQTMLAHGLSLDQLTADELLSLLEDKSMYPAQFTAAMNEVVRRMEHGPTQPSRARTF